MCRSRGLLGRSQRHPALVDRFGERALGPAAVREREAPRLHGAEPALDGHDRLVRGLGLRKIGSVSELEDTAAVRGMINKISYLVKLL